MSSSTHLTDLIHSLTKAEKRHLKMKANLQEGEKRYLRLFEIYEKHPDSDEEIIAKAWQRIADKASLTATKKYLYEFILSGLEQFHAHTGSKAEIQTLLKQVDILFNKALYEQCAKLLKSARKYAEQYQSTRFMLEIIIWELRITLSAKYHGEIGRTPHELLTEERQLLEDLIAINKARTCRFSAESEKPETTLAVELEAMRTPGQRAIVVCEVERALAVHHEKMENYSEALTALEHERHVLREAQPILDDRVIQSKYLNCLGNCVKLYIDQGNYERSETLLAELSPAHLQKQFMESHHLRLQALAHYHQLSIRLFLAMQKPEGLTRTIAQTDQSNILHEGLQNQIRTPLRFHISMALHRLANHSSALRELALVEKSDFQDCPAHLELDVHWLKMMIHYDKQSLDSLEYLLDSISRRLKQSDSMREEDGQLLNLFRALKTSVTGEDRLKAFVSCLADFPKKTTSDDLVLDYFRKWCVLHAKEYHPQSG